MLAIAKSCGFRPGQLPRHPSASTVSIAIIIIAGILRGPA